MVGTSRRRETLWNLFFHYCAIAFTVVQGLVLVPLYLHYIPVPLYGAWLATGNIAVWFTLVDPGLANLLQQRVAEACGRGDYQEVGRLTVLGGWINGGFVALFVTAGLICAPFVGRWVGLTDVHDVAVINRCFALSIVSSGIMLGAFLLGAVNIGMQLLRPAGVLSVGVMGIALAGTIVLLHLGFGLVAIPLAMLFRAVFWLVGSGIIMIWQFRRQGIPVRFKPSMPDGFSAMFGLTFFDRAFSGVASNIDSFLVARFLGSDQVAVLNLTRRPFQAAESLLSRPALAFIPAVAHAVGAGETIKAGRILARVIHVFVWIAVPMVVGLYAFNADIVRFWVGSHLFAGAAINLLLCASLVCSVTVNSLANLCWALGNVHGNCRANIAQNALSVALLMPGFAWIGLAAVLLAPITAMVCVSLWYYPLRFATMVAMERAERWGLVREGLLAAGAAIAPALLLHALPRHGWLDLVLQGAIFGAAFVALMAMFSPSFRWQIRELPTRWSSRRSASSNPPRHIG